MIVRGKAEPIAKCMQNRKGGFSMQRNQERQPDEKRTFVLRDESGGADGLMQALQVINAKGDEGEIEEILRDAKEYREWRNHALEE